MVFSNFTETIFVQFFCYSFTVSQIQLFSTILQFQTCNFFTSFFNSMFIGHTFKISSFFLCLFIGNFFLYRFFHIFLHFLHLVQTIFIVSLVQFIYIGLLQCFIRHTCYSSRFSLVILQKKFFVQFCYSFTVSQIQLFSSILYFHTCNSFISLFYNNVYRSHVQIF